MIPRKLKAKDIAIIVAHLLTLQGEDRRLRFGGMVSDDYIIDYAEKSFLDESQWFGCFDEDDKLVAACHVAIYNGESELGCSVNKEYRGAGYAQAMFSRAVTWLRTKGISGVFMHCLTENQAMRHIAKKNDMVIVSLDGETDANVLVDPPTPVTVWEDAYLDKIAMYDMIYKKQMRLFKNFYNKGNPNV